MPATVAASGTMITKAGALLATRTPYWDRALPEAFPEYSSRLKRHARVYTLPPVSIKGGKSRAIRTAPVPRVGVQVGLGLPGSALPSPRLGLMTPRTTLVNDGIEASLEAIQRQQGRITTGLRGGSTENVVSQWLQSFNLQQYYPSFVALRCERLAPDDSSPTADLEISVCDLSRMDLEAKLCIFNKSHQAKLFKNIEVLRRELGLKRPNTAEVRARRAPPSVSGFAEPVPPTRPARNSTLTKVGSTTLRHRRIKSKTGKALPAVGAAAVGDPQDWGAFHLRKTFNGSTLIGGNAMLPLPPPATQRHYVGETRDGKPHGRGQMVEPDRHTYDGEWAHGKRNGHGTQTALWGEEYTGQWRADKYHGRGMWRGRDGSSYDGDFQNGVWMGRGAFSMAEGTVLVGNWRGGVLHGQGSCKDEAGEYVGGWLKGERHGKGKLVKADGSVYNGDWKLDKQTGRAAIINEDGDQYVGGVLDGMPQGKGELTNAAGGVYAGAWQEVKR